MRQTCILIFSMAVAFSSHAQGLSSLKNPNSGNSLLSITNLSAEDVKFEIDGQLYADAGVNLNIQGLRPGAHQVVLYTSQKSGGLASLRRFVLFNKAVAIKPQYYVDIIINRFGRVVTDEQSLANNQYQNNQVIWRNPGSVNAPPPLPGGPVPPPPPPPNNQSGNGWPPRNNYNNGAPRPMDDNTFNSFVETVRRESFDDSRMAIARAGIDQNLFTSNQAKALLSVFSFEASKLEIAKYMYGKTIDPKNYFVVYNVFTFSKSKEELAEYVRTH
ncbi:hypothetical protein A4H97_20530 [Niastella yeongjuensis]|uniref:DUF4476 domain-containing protein n=1 Tax=Niastella yeongjuensis TaxID=354355 RepID=A0A1V9FCS4_9BACT|nr:DUF4476 domain-containing protein [Niastella yeongjuensis]OQP55976.1 hypothetical protein A4H97_20530 [Niastella yeongjuensis]SEP25866.1 protein of unknown function [Niastella yeongjuensis]